MIEAAGNLEIEEAARLRDEIKRLEAQALGIFSTGKITGRPKGRSIAGQGGTRAYKGKSRQKMF